MPIREPSGSQRTDMAIIRLGMPAGASSPTGRVLATPRQRSNCFNVLNALKRLCSAMPTRSPSSSRIRTQAPATEVSAKEDQDNNNAIYIYGRFSQLINEHAMESREFHEEFNKKLGQLKSYGTVTFDIGAVGDGGFTSYKFKMSRKHVIYSEIVDKFNGDSNKRELNKCSKKAFMEACK